MANGDYGYFGKGDTGYAQYMTAFNRNFGGSSGGGNHNNGGGGDGSGCGWPHRHCGGGRAGAPRYGELTQAPQVKHRFCLCGFLKPFVETGGLW